METIFGASLFVNDSGANYWVCINEPLILWASSPCQLRGVQRVSGFTWGIRAQFPSGNPVKLSSHGVAGGIWHLVQLCSQLKHSQKFVSPFWLRIFVAPEVLS